MELLESSIQINESKKLDFAERAELGTRGNEAQQLEEYGREYGKCALPRGDGPIRVRRALSFL